MPAGKQFLELMNDRKRDAKESISERKKAVQLRERGVLLKNKPQVSEN